MNWDESQQQLVSNAKAGDRAAFEALIRPLFLPAYRLAYGMLRDRGEAEDVVQEASLKAWNRIRDLREATEWKAWLFSIVANQCRTVRRSRWWSVQKLGELPATPKDADQDVVVKADLADAINRLSQGDRLALVLRYYLDLSFDEVAATLGVSVDAARSRTQRAVRRLRPAFKPGEGDSSGR